MATTPQTDIGRNDPCHCGSGKKYKKCHLEKDEQTDRKAREKAALNAAKVAAEEAKENPQEQNPSGPKTGAPTPDKKGWLGKMANKMGFSHTNTQRRTPSANKGG
jgi:hypothetical protein